MPGIQKNVAYTLDIGLFLSGSLVMSPTLATGDFKISKDNGATANLATLPVVSPSSSGVVKVVLAQAEMNADRVTIIGRDAAGANWEDVLVALNTTGDTVDTVKTVVDSILVDTGTTLDTKLNTIDDFLDTEIAAITAAVITNAAGADVAADIIAVKAETATILTDTGTTLDGKLNTIDNFLDTEIAAITAAVITNAAGADIAADIIAVKAETAAIVNDTDLIDDGTSGLAKIATDVASILVDTGTTLDGAISTIDSNVDAILVDTGTTLDTKLNDIQGGTFSSTDSLEAIRNRGDAAWTTGAGGSDRLLLADTTIATLASQTSFTLSAASADNDAYNNCTIVVEDGSTATQKAIGMVLDYVGSTKTVTLKEALAFTIAATDKVYILAENSLKSTVANRQIDVTATGAAGIDWSNVENPTTAVDLSGTDIQLVDTTTANTDMRGTDSAATAANLATVDTVVDGIQADLSNGTDGLGALKTLVDTANTDLSNGTDGLGAIKTAVDAIPTTAMRGTDSANTTTPPTTAEIATAVLTTQMTEAYAANGVAPTLAQAQFAVHQFMMQHGISGTAWTVRKLDNTTTAFVVTLDDATSPVDAKRV